MDFTLFQSLWTIVRGDGYLPGDRMVGLQQQA